MYIRARSPFPICRGSEMTETMARTERPATTQAIVELVSQARATGRRLEVVGGGTKRAIGATPATDTVISLAAMDAVLDYAPEELVLTVQPGARLADLEVLVAAQGQMLPFEPPHLTGLLAAAGLPTLGGALAANLSGPRRIRAGAARDHFLGFEAVTGRGERVRGGGKVVKNVTGYDLSKLMAGSWGTLAVLTEVTIKVLPAARIERTLLIFGLGDAQANEVMTLAMGSNADISGAAHLPRSIAVRSAVGAGKAVTALRIDGFAASVAARVQNLTATLADFGLFESLEGDDSRRFWRQVREVEAFSGTVAPLWRISAPPAQGWRIGAALGVEPLYDWAGGLVWLPSDQPAAVRAAAKALGGHATLYRGDLGVAPFEPLDGALAALTGRVKAAFDPDGVLNPGRMGGS